MERNPCAGDGSGAGAAIGLDDVAVDADLAFAECLQINNGAQRAADEALDFLRAAALLAGGGFALHALMGGARQHAVFGGDPALAAVAQPWRRLFFQAGGDEHMRVAEFYQTGTFGMFREIALEGNLAHLVGFSA
ncbi:hypothetical protein D3C78_939960 [compost metagenome]